VKQVLCIKLVNYRDKYTEMQHGQQNIKKSVFVVSLQLLSETLSILRKTERDVIKNIYRAFHNVLRDYKNVL